jgi:DNA-binding SARP family transcriptional activator
VLRFSILGPLQVDSEAGTVELTGELQRTLVQTLLAIEGKAVSGEALIEELWGDCPPDREVNAFQAHVSRLRRRLRALEPADPPRVLLTPSGYRLVVGRGELDAVDFTNMVREAETLIADDPKAAAATLRPALALWRGPAFGGPSGGSICRMAAARYEELRLRGMELLFDAQLATDRHATILVELNEAHAAHPLRERFCQQLMVALYRAGRQVDALTAYRNMWRRLAEELGVQPSPGLRRVEQAILTHDGDLIDADRTLTLLQPA